MTKKIALAIHGGAGTILRSEMTPELEREYRAGLTKALEIGWKILEAGGAALDAVEAATVALEDFPLFNAGRGAVFTHDAKNEMDAAIMDGRTQRAGAIAFIRNVKNPIKLARLVMEKTPHILLAGSGANEFAREMRVEFEPDEYFFTDFRYQQFLKARAENVVRLDHTPEEVSSLKSQVSRQTQSLKSDLNSEESTTNPKSKIQNPKSLGTVGAVACDSAGNVAAATSTGGMTNKKYGRIGDTPLVGAGTYADNQTCAVSCTGHGEYFMQTVAAYDVAARMKYQGLHLAEAAHAAVEHLREIGGEGGLIAVDAFGNITLPFNSAGMYRACISSDSNPLIGIYQI